MRAQRLRGGAYRRDAQVALAAIRGYWARRRVICHTVNTISAAPITAKDIELDAGTGVGVGVGGAKSRLALADVIGDAPGSVPK